MTNWGHAIALAVAVSGTAAVAVLAQQSPPSLPSFEVASIKPNSTGNLAVSLLPLPSGVNFVNISLRQLILRAYQLQESQLVGGPDWINVERYDVLAKRPASSPTSENPLMLRRLLADRFKLVVRNETRERPIYALVVARPDGRLGPNLRKAPVDCQAMMAQLMRAGGPAPTGEPNVGGRLGCASNMRPGAMALGGTTLPRFANTLTNFVNQIVIDGTGLTGTFDIELSWTPELPAPPLGDVSGALISDAGSIFTAVEEQLGLKLKPQRGPVDVVVIEHVDRPTPD